MSISTTTNRVQYSGDDVTTVFPYTFLILDDTDLEVIETVVSTGVETVKTLTTDYTVSGAGTGSGTVTMIVAPVIGTTLTIRRKMPRTQLADYVENDSFPAATHEQALDKLTMIVQELDQSVKRTLRQPDGDGADITAIPSVSQRASRYLSFDASGNPVASSGTTSTIITTAFTDSLLDDSTADQFVDTLVDAMTAETAPAVGDFLVIDDVSANAGRKITLDNTLKVVNGLTEDTAPAVTADYLLEYDTSAGAAKKVTPESVLKLVNSLTEDTAPDINNDFLLEYDTSAAGVKKFKLARYEATQSEVDAMTATGKFLTPNHKKIGYIAPVVLTGTAVDITGIPAGVRRVIIQFFNVGMSATHSLIFQLGHAGGILNSGYSGSARVNPTHASAQSLAAIHLPGFLGSFHVGTVTLTLANETANQWLATILAALTNVTQEVIHGAYFIDLGAVLDRIRISSAEGTPTFTSGAVSLLYER